MARPMGPRFKVARHLGVNVFNHPKALKRGVKQKKLSEYGKQLLEKQKLKTYYGVLERQFRRYVERASKSKQNPGDLLIQILEKRLDNLVYRIGFASTLRQARQMVVHGHIRVNGQKVNIPSYEINVGDVISLKESSRKNEMFSENFNATVVNVPYIEKNMEDFSGQLVRVPQREEVPIDVEPTRILEFYSR